MTDHILAEADEAGVVFYQRPDQVTDWSNLDPLMQPVCRKINESGWVWTAESCQGHPEASNPSFDWGNRTPFIRLVCQQHHVGDLFQALTHAVDNWFDHMDLEDESGWLATADKPASFKVTGIKRLDGWFEAIVYTDPQGGRGATCAYQRDIGMAAWRAFAHHVTNHAPTSEDPDA